MVKLGLPRMAMRCCTAHGVLRRV